MRRRVVVGLLSLPAMLLCAFLSGCVPTGDIERPPDAVWGRRGIGEGRLQKPRGLTLDDRGNVYIVDMTARIQVFDADGRYLRGWSTPEHETGKPTGISVDRNGNIVVPDTHYFRVLFYSPEGELLDTWGGTNGSGPGEFGFVTDVVQDSQGNYYVSEYGGHDRIQKFSPEGEYLLEWGGHGDAPGRFSRPQSMAVDEHDRIWVADACNHRIQVFDTEGNLLQYWGKQGHAPGELFYPYGLCFGPDDTVFVCEFGNHRVQQFTRDGKWLAAWGGPGKEPGRLNNPWAVAYDGAGNLFVLDTNNHRVQRIRW